ncbi:hypothetical protein KC365_g16064 [Hortaea werneckii]|nr:hypothetical protein KC365_g16064 [Hortaea werneckii]
MGSVPPSARPSQSPAPSMAAPYEAQMSSQASSMDAMPPTSGADVTPDPQLRGDKMTSRGRMGDLPPQINGVNQPYDYATMPGPAPSPPGMVPDHYLTTDAVISTPGIPPTHDSAAALNPQKRSIYYLENNKRSPGWLFIGAAVHIAQAIGLQNDRGLYPPFETEMRRRVWWSIYIWDRIVSLETGRPLHIDDDGVREPMPVDDEYIHPNGFSLPPPEQMAWNGLAAFIPVLRLWILTPNDSERFKLHIPSHFPSTHKLSSIRGSSQQRVIFRQTGFSCIVTTFRQLAAQPIE